MLASMRALLVLSFCAFCACGPKGTTTNGAGTPAPAPSPSSGATPAWSREARTLLERAFGAGRLAWEDPALKPGERLVWRVRATGAPDMVIDLARGQSHPAAPGGTWLVAANGAEIEIDLDVTGAATKLAWKKGASTPATLSDRDAIAKVMPERAPHGEESFVTAGGTFVGNEVVRVPAGEFRARHGLLARGGSTFHVYVARSVPGGLVKLEEFREGALDPVLVLELEDFEKAKKEP